ncbi:MAG: MBL fold metallo-hydrolase [Alphaproteobacteria bacterium]|nr:MBL fold metallo-hydrolase [Alphaproteobacteria bacterium]
MSRIGTGAPAIGLAAMMAFGAVQAATLDDVAKAMGAASLERIEFSGTGSFFAIGQSHRPGVDWPRMNLQSYRRTADYANAATSVDFGVTQALDPPRGGGTQPISGLQRRGGGVVGDAAWNVAGPIMVASGPAAHLHDLWTTPHGMVKAALANKAAISGNSFEVAQAGRFKARATLDAQNRVAKVESWMDNPVLGDMAVVTEYSDWKDHGGVAFPARIKQSMGGHPVLDMAVTEVKVNGAAVAKPERIVQTPIQVAVDKVAEGVWFIHGGSHNSAAIEMRDHVVMYEAPLGDARTNAVIEVIQKTIPGKPIRYVVNSHHHFDHSGGLRAAAAAGATIVTQAMNKTYFEAAYAAPRTIAPDTLAKSGKQAQFLSFEDKHVLTDGERTIEIHRLQGNLHNDALTVAYLPKEKIMILADGYSPRDPITAVATNPNPFIVNQWHEFRRLGLAIDKILPMHGRVTGLDELRMSAGIAN